MNTSRSWIYDIYEDVARKRERESIKVLEAHGACGALISMSGTCLI